MGEMNWDVFYLSLAQQVAEKSKDRSTKVGVVIVGPDYEVRSIGYNGFPRGVDDNIESRHERPAKYMFTEHAERNALYNALRANIPVKGCTLYLNYAPYPCDNCTRGVIQAGISRIVTTTIDFPGLGNWAESLQVGGEMLREAGVKVDHIATEPSAGYEGFDFPALKKSATKIVEANSASNEVKPRKERSILAEAIKLVHGDRNATYGDPSDDFSRTATMLEGLYREEFSRRLQAGEPLFQALDIPRIQICVKLSRTIQSPSKRDSWVDIAGYSETADWVTNK